MQEFGKKLFSRIIKTIQMNKKKKLFYKFKTFRKNDAKNNQYFTMSWLLLLHKFF